MKIVTVTCLLFSLLLLGVQSSKRQINEVDYSENNDDQSDECESYNHKFFKKTIDSSKIDEFKFEIEIPSVQDPSKLLASFVTFDKKEIDIFLQNGGDVVKEGIWKYLIVSKKYAPIKYMLNKWYTDRNFHRETFRQSIIDGSTGIASFLLENSISYLKKKNKNFVNLATQHERFRILRMMAKFNFQANFKIPADLNYSFPLHLAVKNDNVKLVRALFRFEDIEVNCVDIDENTPLNYSKSLEIISILLSKGANPYKFNTMGFNAIDFAANSNHSEKLKLFIPQLGSRYRHFLSNLKKSSENNHFITEKKVSVTRKNCLEDSFNILDVDATWYSLDSEVKIKFVGESGIDLGGLNREWMSILMERLFVPRYEYSENDSEEFIEHDVVRDSSSSSSSSGFILNFNFVPDQTIYLNSPFEPVDLVNKLYRISSRFSGPPKVFKFIGSLLGKALISNFPVRVKFVPSILKLLMGIKLKFDDLQHDDPAMYRMMLYCLDPEYDFNEAKHTLISDESIQVTKENGNVQMFLDETAVDSMYIRFKEQIDQLVIGFNSILKPQFVKTYFSVLELQEIFAGNDLICRRDLRTRIFFQNHYWISKSEMFWEAIDLLTDGELILLIKFITGINGLPFGGVKNLENDIRIFDTKSLFPRASTCMYHLSLPTQVDSVESLLEVFRIAMSSTPEFIDNGCC